MSVSGKDYYKILGVPKTATEEDIKKAYRKLARKHHPDLNAGDKKAEERFKDVQGAYDLLSDPAKRSKYDMYGDNWEHVQPGNPGASAGGGRAGAAGSPFVNLDLNTGQSGGFEDLWELFGGRGNRRTRPGTGFPGRSAAPPEDVEYSLDVSLEDAYRGVTKRINVTVEDICPECEGIGLKRNSRGQFDANGPVCPKCRSRGRVEASRTGDVAIPAGAWDGLRLKLSGQAGADANGQKGDLYVVLHILPHARFEREGQNLSFDVSVPYTIAALGGEINVETLGGQKRQLLVPAGIQTGQKMRLSGQGMPALQDRKAGDAFARVKITVPRDLSELERGLLEQLAQVRNEPIRPKAS